MAASPLGWSWAFYIEVHVLLSFSSLILYFLISENVFTVVSTSRETDRLDGSLWRRCPSACAMYLASRLLLWRGKSCSQGTNCMLRILVFRGQLLLTNTFQLAIISFRPSQWRLLRCWPSWCPAVSWST